MKLKIIGNGFGEDINKVSVSYSGLATKVLSVKPREIEVEIP